MTQQQNDTISLIEYADKHILLTEYLPFMQQVCYKLMPNNPLANDLCHDIYLDLFNRELSKLRDIKVNGNMEGLIFKMIYKRRHLQRGGLLKDQGRIFIELPDVAGQAEIDTSMLDRLNDFEHQVLAVYLKYGTITEAVKQTKINKNAFCNYINRIFEKLK